MDRRPRMLLGGLGVAVAVTGGLLLVIGGADDVPRIDKHPANPLTLDWKKGRYEGIGLHSSKASVIRRLGRPVKQGPNEAAEPIGEDYYDIGGPTSHDSPGEHSRLTELRFKRRAFSVSDGRVYGWVTTSRRAQTPEGVGVGDSRHIVRERYPNAECRIGNEGTEYSTFPLCEIRACRGRLLVFGGDPIRSIWLIAETRQGWDRCQDATPTRRPSPAA